MLFSMASCKKTFLRFCFVLLIGLLSLGPIAQSVQAAPAAQSSIETAKESVIAAPVLPKFLTLEALPEGFAAATSNETESCQMAGEVTAFVLKQAAQPVELICTTSFSLATATENPEQAEAVRKIYDAILKNPKALVNQAKSMGVKDVKVLKQLQGIGDVATGFSKTELGIGQTDVLLFRRGDLINSVLIRYEVDHQPIVPLRSVARQIDQQASQWMAQSAQMHESPALKPEE